MGGLRGLLHDEMCILGFRPENINYTLMDRFGWFDWFASMLGCYNVWN